MLLPFPATPLSLSHVRHALNSLRTFEYENFQRHSVDQWLANRSDFCDALLNALWQHFFAKNSDLALFAVGGYGRQEMFPHSDWDLLLLTQGELSADTAEKIRAFWQFLWDCGIQLGQSVRTLNDCLKLGQKDISIATNLFERRFLCGDTNLAAALDRLMARSEFWPKKCYHTAKIAEQRSRYARFNHTSYNLEPDLKYNPGGLRDLHGLYWFALRVAGVKNLEQLRKSQWIDAQEYQQLKAAQHCLFTLRFALHLLLPRADNRLLFDRQKQLSQFLGYNDDDGENPNAGVEKMMKSFFQSARTLAVFRHILQQQNIPSGESEPLDEYFSQMTHENTPYIFLHAGNFTQTPTLKVQLFAHLHRLPKAKIHPQTLRALWRSTSPVDSRADEQFLHILLAPNGIARGIVPMHRYGVLACFLPHWQRIQGLMQFDRFHLYSVDEHIVRVLQTLENLAENSDLCPTVFKLFQQFSGNLTWRRTLYLAALFHDLGKGLGGKHERLGVDLARDFCQRLRLSPNETAHIAWLVEQHLLMTKTAYRRDIEDNAVILEFAQKAASVERLQWLLCLTVADIIGTNPQRWTAWQAALLIRLYEHTHHALTQPNKITNNRQQRRCDLALRHLIQRGFTPEKIHDFWRNIPASYFLRTRTPQLVWHAAQALCASQHPLIALSPKPVQGNTEIFIHTADQRGLFYRVAGLLDRKKISIHQAQIITTAQGLVLDSFLVSEPNGEPLNTERRQQIQQALQTLLSHPENHTPMPKHSPNVPFHIPTEIQFVKQSNEQTGVEFSALDRPGLLARIGEVFHQQGLVLHQARISTLGEKVQDFFSVSTEAQHPLNLKEKTALRQALLHL